MKSFFILAINSFLSGATAMLIWFAMSLWVYVNTQSVMATSLMSGIYMISLTVTGVWFGSLVDHHKKKTMLLGSSIATLIAFLAAFAVYLLAPENAFTSHSSPLLWLFIGCVFTGVIVGNIRNIAMPTVVTLMVPESDRDKANGILGTLSGISFLLASVISGFLLASSGMFWIMIIALVTLVASILHLLTLNVPEKGVAHIKEPEAKTDRFDFITTFKTIRAVPGLLALILFTSFNNFLGGVFMPLLDPYGLSLVSLEVWGIIWGFLSLGFILGGLFIAKFGLGKQPLRTLFMTNVLIWMISIFFTIQPWIMLLCVGMFIYICFVPFIEASEHTVIQKIVPKDRQGRVFGFAQSIETSASPLTALVIGPLAQYVFIPFMTTGAGVELLGGWFGTGQGRGIALVFITTGIIGLTMTLVAWNSKQYRLLSRQYAKK